MKHFKRIITAIIIAVATLLLSVMPVLAISNPDGISIDSQRVFQNVFESGDILFIANYDVDYTTEPTESSDAAFLFNIYGTDGTTLLYSRGIEYYQNNVISIYLDATQATALTWGNEYVLKLMGNPTMFATITEDVNKDTVTLASDEWISGTLTTTPDFIYAYLYNVMEDMAVALDPLEIIVNSSDGDVLNSVGSTYFKNGIPDINMVVPELFQTSSTEITVPDTTSTGDLATELTISSTLGTSINSAFNLMGEWLGISKTMAGGIFILGICLFVVYIAYRATSNTTLSFAVAIPFVILGTWSGLIPLALTLTIAILITLYMLYNLVLRGA